MKWCLLLFLAISAFAKDVPIPSYDYVAGRSFQEEKNLATFTIAENEDEHYTGFVKTPTHGHVFTHEVATARDIPQTYDLRPRLTPIQNQGSCGSCWAFSLTAALRDALALFNKDPGNLSQQYLVDCAKNAYGCNGGTFEAAEYLVSPQGPALLTDYPYTARNGRCKNLPAAGSIVEWHYVGQENRPPTIEEIQQAILQYGEVSVTVNAGGYFGRYSGGVLNSCSYGGTNHMIDIVGWDNAQKYWIVRNSWGTKWGENGWGRIVFTDKRGKRCNNLAEDAVFVKVIQKPQEKVFDMENKHLKLHIVTSPENTMSSDDIKATLQTFMDKVGG